MSVKNILITGSKGFIGKNLKKELLNNRDINIFEFNRDDSFDSLNEIIKDLDFIFHFAGEVRPSSSSEDFVSSHNTLTIQIIKCIESNNCRIPILFTSSKHASNPKNIYGQTKQETEDIIKEYSSRNDVPIYIYRLPHVFGEGCKSNYNSVISTWINNSIRDLEINIFDRNIIMKYVYVQDVIKDFIKKININKKDKIFHEIEPHYDTTLGEVVDYITEFKLNINNEKYFIIENNEFKKKLFLVYRFYKNELLNKEINEN